MTAPRLDARLAALASEADATGQAPDLEALLDRAEQMSPYEEDNLFEYWCANLPNGLEAAR